MSSANTLRRTMCSPAFLQPVDVASAQPHAKRHRSATHHLTSSVVKYVVVDQRISLPRSLGGISIARLDLEPVPYHTLRAGNKVSDSTVYCLYEDIYQSFLYRTRDAADGTSLFSTVHSSLAGFSDAAIPVPSGLCSMKDIRPLIGYKEAVRDKGPRAWAFLFFRPQTQQHQVSTTFSVSKAYWSLI